MMQTHVSLEQLNLNLMLALHWLLVEQSVTRAARRMGVTQSAMSRSLGQLRVLLGDQLFVTVGRRLEPTRRATKRTDNTLHHRTHGMFGRRHSQHAI
jgi:hypothetical protein